MSENYSIIETVDMSAFAQTMAKIQQFQDLVRSQLTEGHDYGTIPGTSKPSLLKPGAEKILMLMGLTSKFDIIDSTRNYSDGFFQYQIKCRLYKNGVLITEGLGACNTMEARYIKQDPYTLDNTMLKMAKKRALVDAALLVASLSQIFTQDVEDMGLGQKRSENLVSLECISKAQAKRMYAISNGNAELCKSVCLKYGYKASAEVRKVDYDKICEEIRQAAQAA